MRKKLLGGALLSIVAAPVLIALVMGSSAQMTSAAGTASRFYCDYTTLDEEEVAAKALNIELEQESVALLKNAVYSGTSKTLPLNGGVKRVSVFGATSTHLFAGGSGSGSSTSDPNATLKLALEGAGLEVNPLLNEIYGTINSNLEQPVSVLSAAADSYALYHDAAILVLSRTGSEFSDNKAYNADGHSNPLDHYLMLQDNEKALISHIEEHFSRIVVLINSASPMELGDLQNDPKIGGILWIGFTGYNGALALGNILVGNATPSGHLVDIYPRDFKKDPTWTNFSDNSQVAPVLGNDGKYTFAAKDAILDPKGAAYKNNGWKASYYNLEYKEGIYMGYRYYETADMEAKAGNYAGFDYDEAVVYPFGYGQSYTSFDWSVIAANTTDAIGADSLLNIKVKVTNTGDYAGKDVVQAYYGAPYTVGGIEKAAVNLGDFAKTRLLQPGDFDIVDLQIKARDMASFDYSDANANGFKGYELEAGAYAVTLRHDSHNVEKTLSFSVPSAVKFTTSAVTGKDIKPVFSSGDEYDTTKKGVTVDGTGIKFMTRADFATTFPATSSDAERTFAQSTLDWLDGQFSDYAYEDKTTDPWYLASAPANWTQLSEEEAKTKTTPESRGINLLGMTATDLDSPDWDTVMNNMAYSEMVFLLQNSSRKRPGLDAIGKNAEADDDGPAQLKHSGLTGMAWVSEVNIAATWNTELVHRQGLMVGNEGLLMGMTGWYGPATDTHRSPLSGRNFEYYSQDGFQGGKIAAAVVKGAIEKGMHVYIKHFALNDQEKHRGDTGGVLTWANEQSMREIYFKSFQMAVEDGGCNGTMGAFNRIGANPAMAYPLYRQILENEWGYKGVSDTDIGSNKWTGYDYIRCHTYPMGSVNRDGTNIEGSYDPATNTVQVIKAAGSAETISSPTQWQALRETVRRVLYVYTHTNAVQNGIDFSKFVDNDALTGQVGTALTDSLALDAADLKNSTLVRYAITSGTLPAGVAFTNAGLLSGTPTVSGSYEFAVTCTVDGWVKKTSNFKLNVASAFTLSESKGTEGVAFASAITTSVFTEANSYNSNSYALISGALPKGVSLAADGSLSGTPSEYGNFSFTVDLTTKRGTGSRVTTYHYQETFALDIAEAPVVAPVVHNVSFDLNYSGASAATSVGVENGRFVKAPVNPIREGYTFIGWFADATCKTPADFSQAITADVTFYAGWVEVYDSAKTSQEIGNAQSDADKAQSDADKAQSDATAAKTAADKAAAAAQEAAAAAQSAATLGGVGIGVGAAGILVGGVGMVLFFLKKKN